MTLDELLALLPDNDTGEITAADLRTVVTELYNQASTAWNAYNYKWTTSAAPSTGAVNIPWAAGPQTLHLSETTSGGLLFPTDAVLQWVRIRTASSEIVMTVNGPGTDMGGYQDFLVNVDSVSGAVPSNNASVTVGVGAQV